VLFSWNPADELWLFCMTSFLATNLTGYVSVTAGLGLIRNG
jgi:hypothetical protein